MLTFSDFSSIFPRKEFIQYVSPAATLSLLNPFASLTRVDPRLTTYTKERISFQNDPLGPAYYSMDNEAQSTWIVCWIPSNCSLFLSSFVSASIPSISEVIHLPDMTVRPDTRFLNFWRSHAVAMLASRWPPCLKDPA